MQTPDLSDEEASTASTIVSSIEAVKANIAIEKLGKAIRGRGTVPVDE